MQRGNPKTSVALSILEWGEFKNSIVEPKTLSEVKHMYLKDLAVFQLGKQMNLALQLRLDSEEKCSILNPELKTMYSWGLNECLKRIKDAEMLELLSRHFDVDYLDTRKKIYDHNELTKYINLIIQTFIDKDNKIDVFKLLQNCVNYIELDEILTNQVKKNKEKLLKEVRLIIALEFISRSRLMIKSKLKRDIFNRLLTNNISVGYVKRYKESLTDQTVYDGRYKENNIQAQIDHYTNRTQNEHFAAQCALNCYFTVIDDLRYRLSLMEHEYDTQMEALDVKIAKQRMDLERISAQQDMMKEQLQRYSEDVEEWKHTGDLKRRTRDSKFKRRSTVERKSIKYVGDRSTKLVKIAEGSVIRD